MRTKAEAKKKKGILAAKRQAWTNFISDLGPKDQTKMWSFVKSMTDKGTDPTPDGQPINNNGMATTRNRPLVQDQNRTSARVISNLSRQTLSISAMPILHMYFGRTPASSVDPGLIYQYWHNRNGQEMDKVWRLKLEMTRADVRFRYAANNGAKQHWTNIQHSNIKN
ncbi:hypothetical protein OUZ56_026406 [Daphnia magna]|uniref:Uncharacterized protein n=1 Tax=Daphnia magna TaxID=35525 RepID=A0ABQ9ZM33_9CRUS|nr:hypothetical protein OUZ56_026406 [Daphnia magna]